MTIAIYPGSFDPVTFGHLDIIRRAAGVFDKLIIGVLKNHTKTGFFTTEERLAMLDEVTRELTNVEVVSFDGLLVDYCEAMNVNVIVRGIRAVSDFEFELTMAQTNKQLNSKVETLFFATSAEYSFISSSSIREIAFFGGDVSHFVPDPVRHRVEEKMKPGRNPD